MATPTLVSVEEYLARIYHPDREYVDGVVVERDLGERDHSRVVAVIASRLVSNEARWRVITLVSARVQVGATRFRIPDICLLAADDPDEPIVRAPPLVCIEVLSPEDRIAVLEAKIVEYFEMGVRAVWVIDPIKRLAYSYTVAGKQEVTDDVLRVPNFPVHLPLAEIFDKLPRR